MTIYIFLYGVTLGGKYRLWHFWNHLILAEFII